MNGVRLHEEIRGHAQGGAEGGLRVSSDDCCFLETVPGRLNRLTTVELSRFAEGLAKAL